LIIHEDLLSKLLLLLDLCETKEDDYAHFVSFNCFSIIPD